MSFWASIVMEAEMIDSLNAKWFTVTYSYGQTLGLSVHYVKIYCAYIRHNRSNNWFTCKENIEENKDYCNHLQNN